MSGKPRIPEAEWDGICSAYRAGADAAALAQPYGLGREVIYRILRKKGLTVEKRGGSPPICEATQLLICNLYKNKHGASSIARQFGINKSSVYNILVRAGIGTRPRSNRVGDEYHIPEGQQARIDRERLGHTRGPKGNFNRDAFKEMDERACYWAGYLITDGCIGAYDGRSYRLYLPQARKHREQCEKLKGYLQSDLDVANHKKETFGRMRDFSRVSFTLPDEVAQRLLQLGIRPAKTAVAKASACLLNSHHFWRGVIDGDGSCYPCRIRMASSSSYLAGQYRRFVRSKLNIPLKDVHVYRNQEGVWMLESWGLSGFRITNALYACAASDCRLQRKFDIASGFINRYKTNNPGQQPWVVEAIS